MRMYWFQLRIAIMREFPEELPRLAILTESLDILDKRDLFPPSTQGMLQERLRFPATLWLDFRVSHYTGDAHMGNL